MREYFSKLEESVPYLENKPHNFKKAFCNVFGLELRDEEDVYILTEEICDLMWEKVGNGRVMRKEDIHLLRGKNGFSLGEEENEHHWPPISRGGKRTITIPVKFHKDWHVVFVNLYKKREIEVFLNKLFTNNEIDDFNKLHRAAKKAKKEAKKIKR